MTVPIPLLPPPLQQGDTIAVITPSWPGPAKDPATFARALSNLRETGFKTTVTAHATSHKVWTSGIPEDRASDLHAAFADPDVRAIITTIGGNHSAQLLPHLDLELIRSNPKVLCGYSDVTVLHHALHQTTGLVTFYGPALLPQWGEHGGPFPYTLNHFLAVTSGQKGPIPVADRVVAEDYRQAHAASRPRLTKPSHNRQVARPGRATGRLMPICLPSIRHLIGTPWQPDFTDALLLLDIPDNYEPEDADADLTHLQLAGALNAIVGVALCRVPPPNTLDAFTAVVTDHTTHLRCPVGAGFEAGHTDPMPTYPLGIQATMNDGELTIESSATAPRSSSCQEITPSQQS